MRAFRRIVLHLGGAAAVGRLFIQELTYDQPVLEQLTRPPAPATSSPRWVTAWPGAERDDTFTLTRAVRGRVLISNYDPLTLSDAERQRLNEIAPAGRTTSF